MTTINDLMDLTLREILEKYVSVQSLECGYYYGITTVEDANRIFENYGVTETYSEAFYVDNLINDELLIDCDKPVLSYKKMEEIMQNLGVSKKW